MKFHSAQYRKIHTPGIPPAPVGQYLSELIPAQLAPPNKFTSRKTNRRTEKISTNLAIANTRPIFSPNFFITIFFRRNAYEIPKGREYALTLALTLTMKFSRQLAVNLALNHSSRLARSSCRYRAVCPPPPTRRYRIAPLLLITSSSYRCPPLSLIRFSFAPSFSATRRKSPPHTLNFTVCGPPAHPDHAPPPTPFAFYDDDLSAFRRGRRLARPVPSRTSERKRTGRGTSRSLGVKKWWEEQGGV